MKARQNVEKFKVTPVNLVTGSKAPSFVFEYQKNNNVDLKRIAKEDAESSSRLSSYETWDFQVEKI